MFPLFLYIQYDKCQMTYTGMTGQGARFKQISYPLTLDGLFAPAICTKSKKSLSMKLTDSGTLEDNV